MKTSNFESLIKKWQDEGVLNTEQADYMLADLSKSTSEGSGKKFIYSVGIIGGLTLSAGVLLMIASNWSELGKSVKLLLSLLMPIVPISLAYYVLFVKQSETIWGNVCNLFGMFLIGGSLAMIGQIYNLESSYTGLLWMWSLLSAVFIILFKKVENVSFTAVAVGVATASLLIDSFSLFRDTQALFLSMTLAALLYAGVLYVVGSALRESVVWHDSARALRLISASVATTTLFVTTFEFYARQLVDAGFRDGSWIPASIILNLIFLGFMVFVLMRAFRYQEERLALSVIRLLGIYLVVKYFTLFSDMLDTGALMVVGGLLFISGAWYLEKNKHQLLEMMRPPAKSSLQQQPQSFIPKKSNDYNNHG